MRRFPLTALLGVLLVGCQSSVAPYVPTPQQPSGQSLSFEISGPSRIDYNGPVSWEAFAFGGSGAYQYRWEVTRLAGTQAAITTQATTTTVDRRFSLLVTETDGNLVLRVTVTSGDQVRVENFAVRNCIGGC